MKIEKNNVDKLLHLSPVQNGMLYHYLLDGNNSAYFHQVVFELRGKLDLEVFQKSYNCLLNSHEALKTIFVYEKVKTPVQVVLKKVEQNVIYEDISDHINQNDYIEEVMKEDRARGIDLSNELSMRIFLFKLSEDNYKVLWDCHHIIMDGFSIGLVIKQLFEIYEVIQNGLEVKYEEAQFSRYIEWLDSVDKDEALDYWTEELNGVEEGTTFPYVYSTNDFKVNNYKVVVSNVQFNALKKYAALNHVTVNSLIQVLWGILIAKYNNTNDVVWGNVTSGRSADVTDIEKIIGVFINTMPLRLSYQKEEKVSDLLVKMNQSIFLGEQYAYLQLTDIQHATVGNVPLFNHIVAYENLKMTDYLNNARFGNFIVNDAKFYEPTNYDLAVKFEPGQDLTVNFEFNEFAYDNTVIERLANDYLYFIDLFLNNPEMRISDYDVISEIHKEYLDFDFNNIETDLSYEGISIQDIFNEQVRMYGDKVAIEYRDIKLTYRDLDWKASCIADELVSNGVKPNDVVAIQCAHDIYEIIGILGILKAGAAYLPVDTEFPESRKNHMLSDCKVSWSLVFGEDSKIDKCNKINVYESALYEKDYESCKKKLSNITYSENDVAYIIYTSGSTGNPKGVEIMQKSIKSLVKSDSVIREEKNARVLQMASFAFDASIYEIFAPILNGATVVLASDSDRSNTDNLCSFIKGQKITSIFITTQLFNALVDYDSHCFDNVKKVMFGGESASVKHIQKAISVNTNTDFYNIYGPTETTVFACLYLVKEILPGQVNVPIGRPLPDTSFYVLDKDKNLLPMGMPGELYIGGFGLAKGYLNQEELTNSKFIVNPFDSNERLYKTGDVVRWTKDHQIEFIGRADNQVKIRGFRIELDEITNRILEYPAIKEVIVLPINVQSGYQLCAYYVSDEKINQNDLSTFLFEFLPDYMIPNHFVKIDEIPLNRNGKVDKTRLPKPLENVDGKKEFVAATGEEQKVLVDVWKHVLGVNDDISIDDNFFMLGGDSIKAMQISAYLKKYNMTVNIRDIFKYPTVRQLAETISVEKTIESVEEKGLISLNPVQQWFFEEQFEERNHFNQAVLLKGKVRFDIELLESTFDRIVELHPSLRTVFVEDNGTIYQKIISKEELNEKTYGLVQYDFYEAQDEKNSIEITCEELQSSLNISKPKLFNVGHFKTKSCDYLLIAVHHLVIDGVSFRILLDDFAQIYSSLSNNQSIEIPGEATTFGTYVRMLESFGKNEDFVKHIKPFGMMLGVHCEKIKRDHEIEKRLNDSMANISFELSDTETNNLLDIQNKVAGISVNDLLVSSLANAIGEWSGISSFAINLEGHGREIDVFTNDLSRTMGWFTTMTPVILNSGKRKNRVQDIKSISHQLKVAKEASISYGIEKYFNKYSNAIIQSVTPEISFNYLGQFDWEIDNDLFEKSNYNMGNIISLQQHKCFALDINIAIVNHSLNAEITYNKREYDLATIESFADIFKREILENVDISESNLIPKEPFDLTSIQMAYLLGKQGMYERGGFTTHNYIEVETQLSIPRLNDALNKVIKRQHMLRAVILENGTQQILEEVPRYEIEMRDLRNDTEEQQLRVIEDVREKTSHAVFDISKWPLFEIKGVQLDDNRKYLFISYDLLIMDSASAHIFIKELMDNYDKPEMDIPPLKYTYYDFVTDIASIKRSNRYEISKHFWQEKLKDFPQAPALKLKKSATDAATSKFLRLEHLVSENQWNMIKRIANKNHTTASAILLTAYGEVLSYWSNQEKLAINLTVFNRYPFHEDINNIIGDFTSVVLCDIDKSNNKSFFEEAEEVQIKLADALEHRFYDGVEFTRDVAKKYNIPQGKAVMPYVFTSLLFEEDVQKELHRFGEMKWSIGQTPQVFIDMQAMEDEGNLKIFCDYVEELFDKEMMDRFFKQFIDILENINDEEVIIKPSMRKEDIEFLESYNQTDSIYLPVTLNSLFSEQVKRNPQKIAVKSENSSLTYEQLDRESNRVANYLISQGLKHDESVAVIAQREVGSIINILGILKADGKYIPINPEYPDERKNFLINDGCCRNVLYADDYLSDKIKNNPDSTPQCEVDPDSLAYVIYTSGSTGNPKGVMIRHSAAANTILDMNERFNIGEDDNILGLSSMCFDLSVYDIFGSVCSGATLVMIPDQRDVGIIQNALEKYNITVWNSVPAIMEMFVDSMSESFSNDVLKQVWMSGDWIPMNLFEKIKNKFSKVNVVSLGGATEASIWSIYYPITSIDEEWVSIPYGMPLKNQKIYILNYEGRECPIGVRGDIYIGGIGVADGYLNNKELTDKAFINHPKFGRIYRTGDYGALKKEGYVEFLGRIDHQIKVRGYRIELGEIESALREFPMIQDAVVNVYKSDSNGQQLVGYVVGKGKEKTEVEDSIVDTIKQAGLESSSRIPEDADPKLYGALMDKLDILATDFIIEAVKILGISTENGCIVNVDEIVKEFGIKETYAKLLRQWMNSLAEEGYVKKIADGCYRGEKSLPETDTQNYIQGIKESPLFEYFEDVFNALILCSENQLDLLTGKKNAIEYLFVDGSFDRAESVYRYNPVAEYKNNVVSIIISSYIQAQPKDKMIRILEFGAGTGGTTSAILPMLPESRVSYTYTDISDYFSGIAKDMFKEYDFVDYDVYNIDEDPLAQGFVAHSYDIVIGANVLHDAKDLKNSISNFNDLLVDKGLLIILEITNNSRLVKISTGYLDGFCAYTDERLISEKTLLTEDEWKNKFEECGFENTMSFPPKDSLSELYREHVIVGLANSKSVIVDVDNLQEELMLKIPEYMVPSKIIQIPSIPLSDNGKVDRKKLPILSYMLDGNVKMVEPKTHMEIKLTEIWKEVLMLEKLSVESDFFEVGGDSLKAIRLVARIKQISPAIELSNIYQSRTVRKLAKVLEEQLNSESKIVLLREGKTSDKNIFFIHGGSGTSSIYFDMCKGVDEEYNCYGIEFGDFIKVAPSNVLVEDMARDYAKYILDIQSEGEYNIVGWCIGGNVGFHITSILESLGKKVNNCIMIDSMHPTGQVVPYTFDSELEIIKKMIPEKFLDTVLPKTNDMDDLWNNIADFFESNSEQTYTIKKNVVALGGNVIEGFDGLEGKEFVNKVNTVRTLGFARNAYKGIDGKLKAKVTFIEPIDERTVDKNVWQEFCCNKIQACLVTGNHFSMIVDRGGEECAKIISDSIMNNN